MPIPQLGPDACEGGPCSLCAAGATSRPPLPPCLLAPRAQWQLTCPGNISANRTTRSVSFTTGEASSNIPTVNATGPVICDLTLVIIDELGQNGTATAVVTVSESAWVDLHARFSLGPRLPRPLQLCARCATRGLAAALGHSMAIRCVMSCAAPGQRPALALLRFQVTNPPRPSPSISDINGTAVLTSLNVTLPGKIEASATGSCSADPCTYQWDVSTPRREGTNCKRGTRLTGCCCQGRVLEQLRAHGACCVYAASARTLPQPRGRPCTLCVWPHTPCSGTTLRRAQTATRE